MVFICLDLKEEVKWVDLTWHLKRMKKKLFLLELLIKGNFSFVIGLLDLRTKQEAKMTP